MVGLSQSARTDNNDPSMNCPAAHVPVEKTTPLTNQIGGATAKDKKVRGDIAGVV
jgi:hypothetical protein